MFLENKIDDEKKLELKGKQTSLFDLMQPNKNELRSDEKVSTTSERLQYYLKKNQKKQKDILEMCQPYCDKYNIRINKSDISQYIRGKANPNQDRLTILSKALGVSEIWLLGYDVPQPLPDEVTKKMINISHLLDKNQFDFVFEAEDDSLFSDHIFKNDLIFFRQQKVFDSGDLVAIMIASQVLIRRVYFNYVDNIVIFKTSNPFDDLVFNIDANYNILGKAVAFISKKINLIK